MSEEDRKDLPPIGSANFLEKVREAVSTYLGNRGDKLDRGITLRDLTDSGIVTLRPGFLNGSGTRSPIGGPGSAISGVLTGGTQEVDLTPPPQPTGFKATAAISNILIECDNPTYTQGGGHLRSKLYGTTYTSGALPIFANAQLLTEFTGSVGVFATNPATTWHLWLKWVTNAGVESLTPAGGTNGKVVRTGEDVAALLTALGSPLHAWADPSLTVRPESIQPTRRAQSYTNARAHWLGHCLARSLSRDLAGKRSQAGKREMSMRE